VATLGRASPRAGRSRRSSGDSPTLVLLVRHGTTPTTGKQLPGRSPALHLAERGREQAERVAERIGELARPPVAVYASPLERTRETAAPIARRLGLRVRSLPGLLEADIGAWTGRSLRQVSRAKEWEQVRRWPSGFRFPGGESFGELSIRAYQAVLELVERHRGHPVVAVSHADPIKAVVAVAAGVPLDLFQRLVISPCSVTALVFGRLGPMVLTVNSTASLGELVPS
jgi:probable phosphomutase (TIGR03848 family)